MLSTLSRSLSCARWESFAHARLPSIGALYVFEWNRNITFSHGRWCACIYLFLFVQQQRSLTAELRECSLQLRALFACLRFARSVYFLLIFATIVNLRVHLLFITFSLVTIVNLRASVFTYCNNLLHVACLQRQLIEPRAATTGNKLASGASAGQSTPVRRNAASATTTTTTVRHKQPLV